MRVKKFAGQYVLPIMAVAALASCCGGKLPDIVSSAGNSAPVAVLVAVPAMAASQLNDVTGDAPLEVSFDASGSYDTDGTIVTFDWDFDTDGTYDLLNGGPTASHTYPDSGQFTATVRVTDNSGLSDTDSATIQVLGADQTPPEAAGTGSAGEDPLNVTYDATASFDLDGEIVQFDWDMDNDGEFEIIDGGPNPSHQFPEFGTYTVRVRVTDDDGFTDTGEIVVTLTPDENLAPSAVLIATPDSGLAPGLEVTFDASLSTDTDGTIVSFDWDMDDDGAFEISAGGPTQGATYDADGVYTVNVRVTDDGGATDTASAQVTVGAILAPTAVLTATPDSGFAPGLEVVFDASGSSDSDGTIVQYDWDMDNNGSFELYDGGVQRNLTYDVDGFYTVRVRVKDNHGATDIAEASVTVGAIVPPIADLTATPDSGNAPLEIIYNANGSTDPDGTIVSYDWDMNDDGIFEQINTSAIKAVNYQDGGLYTVVVKVTDNDGASDSASVTVDINNLPTANLTVDPADGTAPLGVNYDASGSTDTDGSIVQYDWDMDNDGTFEIIDGASIQPTSYPFGGFYQTTVRVTDDDGAIDTTTIGISINNAPEAFLTATPNTGAAPLDVTFDASGSTDSDGIIVSYDWDMDNDGTFEILDSTVTQPANYTSDGLFTAIVRVTDNDGAVDIIGATVFVSTPPTAVLDGEFDGEWQIYWDASGSFDGGNGSIVQYDWDTNNDGTFDIIDGGATYLQQNVYYDEYYTVGVRVTDNDGLTDTVYLEVYTSYGEPN